MNNYIVEIALISLVVGIDSNTLDFHSQNGKGALKRHEIILAHINIQNVQ